VTLKKVLKSFILPFTLTVIVLLVVKKLFLKKNLTEFVDLLSIEEHFICAFFMLVGFSITGFQLKNVFRKSTNIKMSLFDTLSLPIAQNLWGYIIPFQGSFLYSMLFLKSKYKIEVKSSLAVYFLIIIASLFLGGISGTIFLIYKGGDLGLILFFLFFVLCPTFPYIGKWLIEKFNFSQGGKLNQAQQYIIKIIQDITQLLKSKKFLFYVFFVDICYVINYAIWSYWLCKVLDFDVPIIFFILVGFLMKLTSLTKLTPGNIGITQLLVGGTFSLFNLDPEIGVITSLIQLLTTFIFGFPIGLIITIFSFKNFNNLRTEIVESFKKKR
tara:strand:- start:2394 stop:3374 length:981 start_codon:yes stop_codon:yes gene_type:complete